MIRGRTWLGFSVAAVTIGISCALLAAPKDKSDRPEKSGLSKKQKAALEKPVAVPADSVAAHATTPDRMRIIKDFKAELVYDVPKEKQGSWVCLAVDPKGGLIASDQYGSLYHITPAPFGGTPAETTVELIDLPIGHAQGLLYAFNSLYVMVSDEAYKGRGVYRCTDTDGDGKLDKVELLRSFEKGNDHGVHAMLLSPDGKSIYVVHGNQTVMTELSGSRVPRMWSEDHLLPRMPDGRGFMRDVMGPGGCIYKMDPDGKNFELFATGFRNEYDAAFNKAGELFSYDADMEYDINTPWYRPTRVCMVASGTDFGWRNGTGKWPAHYADTLPPVLNIGPGSPTGIAFGYGTKFPAKYQDSLFICDWSYGKLYAVHLTPDGSFYKAEKEEFLGGTPLPLTDIVVNPADGALYFTIGGRKTQSGLYRVTYTGKESTAPAPDDTRGAEARAVRHTLEAFHGKQDSKAIEVAWPHLRDPDRATRSAARIAIEHQPLEQWKDKALSEKDPFSAITAMLALIHDSARDKFHSTTKDPKPDPAFKDTVLTALNRIDWNGLNEEQRLELLRVYGLTFIRLGAPDVEQAKGIVARIDPSFPARTREMNAMLCEMLVYLQAPSAAAKSIDLLEKAPTQEEQLEYAKSLRMLKTGWTMDQRKVYMQWFTRAAGYRGGASFVAFINNIKKEAVAALPADAKTELKPIIDAKPPESPQAALAASLQGHTKVKDWTVNDLAPSMDKGLVGRDFERGRKLFGAVGCFACHRFDNEGGNVGPDLTGAGGRFNARDLLESIITPSKEISDQYAQVILYKKDGDQVVGRIVNLKDNDYRVMTNMYVPDDLTVVDSAEVKAIKPSPLSPMPEGLLNLLQQEEIQDLVAYVLSGGDRTNRMFAKP